MSDSKRRRISEGGDDGDDDKVSGIDDAAYMAADKFRTAMDDAASEFVCPITQELPVDPVTAMDGRVYERHAIADWIENGNGKSPMTNLPMGDALLPAVHVRNSLELMVKSGALTGDKVDAWKKRLKDEAIVDAHRTRAAAGNIGAMKWLGVWYMDGRRGLTVNLNEAASLFQRAYDKGDVQGGGLLGHLYTQRDMGERRNVHLGVHLMTEAATKGDQLSCWHLGTYFRSGRHGLPKDNAMAAKWFRAMRDKCKARSISLIASIESEALAWLSAYEQQHPAPAADIPDDAD